MKSFLLPKLLLIALPTVMLAFSCGGDKDKPAPAKSNSFSWDGIEQAITYAAYAREDNMGGNIYPNEYFELETQTYYLKLIIPQQYLDYQWHNWVTSRSFTIRFKSKIPDQFNFDMTQASSDPNPNVVGGRFKILSMSNNKYELEMNINIRHSNGSDGARIDILKVYYNGTMIRDDSINEWTDPTPTP